MRRSLLASAALASVIGCTDASHLTSPAFDPEVSLSTGVSSLGYVAIDLGTLGGSFAQANGINEAGQIAGFSETTSGAIAAFVWEDGVMTELPSLGGNSLAWALNDIGQIVGQSSTGTGERHVALWENGEVTDLGTLGGNSARARGINNSGVIVGESNTGVGFEFLPFVWTGGALTSLPTLGGLQSGANGINVAGVIAGRSTAPDGTWRAVTWENGVIRAIPILDAAAISRSSGPPNVAGQIMVVETLAVGGPSKSWIWDGTSASPVPGLGGEGTTAGRISDTGIVVGRAETASGEEHAFLYTGSETIDLGKAPGANTGFATDINEQGFIVGGGIMASNFPRATLWRPITPVEAIEEPIAGVEDLVASGGLNQGEGTSLTSKLLIATGLLNDGKTGPAINQLEAFIHQVEAMIPDHIDPVEGQALIDAVQAVIDALGA